MTPEQQQALVKATQAIDEEQKQALAKAQSAVDAEDLQQQGAIRSASSAVASESDSPAWKEIKTLGAIARGTGEGAARIADMPHQAQKYVTEWGKKGIASLAGQDYERQPVGSPLTDLYNNYMPSAPQGYENTNDVASVVGPAVVGTALTGGFAAPEFAATMFPEAVAPVLSLLRGGINTAVNLGTSYLGGQGAKAAVSQVTDDPEAQQVAENIGSFGGPTVASVARPKIGSAFIDQTGTGSRLTTGMDLLRSTYESIIPAAALDYLGLPKKISAVNPVFTGAKYLRDLPFKDVQSRRLFTYDHGLDPDPATLGGTLGNAVTGTASDVNRQNKPLIQPPPVSGPKGWLSNFGVN